MRGLGDRKEYTFLCLEELVILCLKTQFKKKKNSKELSKGKKH